MDEIASASLEPPAKTPRVFISYSRDSQDHISWVRRLAESLVECGIEVVLDQWDVGPGDDLVKFMEASVRDSDRVLMVCTENYVRKANEGMGGVGYESMIVSGELVRDIGTAKFVPLVRQGLAKPNVPTSVSTRYYIDFSRDDGFKDSLEQLVRDVHSTPAIAKPPLGVNPFVSSVSQPSPLSLSAAASSSVELTPEAAFSIARTAAIAGDVMAWRSVVRRARDMAGPRLAEWWQQHGNSAPNDHKTLVQESLTGIEAFCPLMSIALAGVSSGNDKFSNQIGLLEEVIEPNGWQRSGYTNRVGLPRAAGFIYQALVGSVCLFTRQLPTAIRFARSRIHISGHQEQVVLWRAHELVAWPDALGGNSSIAWRALQDLPSQWPWLKAIFGSSDEFLEAICAYYMALSVNEYCSVILDGLQDHLAKGQIRLEVPTNFAQVQEDIARRAYRTLMSEPGAVRDIWRSQGIADKDVSEQWLAWVKLLDHWHGKAYPYSHKKLQTFSQIVPAALTS